MKNSIVLFLTALPLILALSCSKKDNAEPKDYAPAFAGTYNMSSACWSTPRAVTITANGTSSILLPLTLSEGTVCQKFISVPVNVTENTIPQTTVTVVDGCNTVFQTTVSGTLNGNNLSLTYAVSNSVGGGFTCVFSGPK